MAAPATNKALPAAILIVILLVISLGLKHCKTAPAPAVATKELPNKTAEPTSTAAAPTNKTYNNAADESGLVRHPASIHYSKHARCRMGCRHIDESEVQEILAGGTINYKKSELAADDCSKKYAVEGRTHDGQQVRIIFAPCRDQETVVTVIDIGREWVCDCK